MCGGRGTRLSTPVEKPLFEVDERPMIDRVLSALLGSGVGDIHAVLSPAVPDTRAHLETQPVERIDAPGNGYVADMNRAMETVDPPVLTVAADLPLLAPALVDRVIEKHDRGALTVYVPADLKRLLDVSVDLTVKREGREAAPAGINIVSDQPGREAHLSHDVRLAVNVNRRADARVAEELL